MKHFFSVFVVSLLLPLSAYANIYAGQQSLTDVGDGTWHSDVTGGQTVTLLSAVGNSFDQTAGGGVTVMCTTPSSTQHIWYSQLIPIQIQNIAIVCSQIDIYDVGTSGVSNGSVTLTYVLGSTTPDQILASTTAISSPSGNFWLLLIGLLLAFVVFIDWTYSRIFKV